MSIQKRLGELFGGTWKYDGSGTWDCDDGRWVTRCSRGTDGFEDPLPGADYYLYDDNEEYARKIHTCWGPSCRLTGTKSTFGNLVS